MSHDDDIVSPELTRAEVMALLRMIQGHDDEPLRYDAEKKLLESIGRSTSV